MTAREGEGIPSPLGSAGASTEEPVAPQRPAAVAATFRSLRYPNYRLYFFGQLISLTGTWVQTTALLWLAYELERESKWPALVSAAQILPAFVLGPWSGTLADHVRKRRLILATQSGYMLQALLLAGVVLSGAVTPPTLVGLALVGGLVNALDLPARLAFVPAMVGREDLLNAVALNSLLFNVARSLGPMLGGALLLATGPGVCFLVNGLSYVAVLWALARMDIEGEPQHAAQRPGLAALFAGFVHLMHRPETGLLVLLSGALALFGWPALALLPALARATLGVQEGGYSLLLAGVGCGALTAALTVARFGSLARGQRFIGLGLGLAAGGLLGLSVARATLPAVGCCALLGYGLILFFTNSQTAVQLSAEEGNRGRVMGIWSMALSGGVPLGNLLAGPAADWWGEPFVLRLQGFGCAAAFVALLLVRWRR